MAALDTDLSVIHPNYVKFSAEFNQLVTKKPITRQNAAGSSSCRLTALLYLYVYLHQSKIIKPSSIWDKIQELISKNTAFNSIIAQNKCNDYGETVTSTFKLRSKPIHFMGMVMPSNIISHYFLIVQRGDGYYLVSSYGSDTVCIRQYETKLELGVWTAFIDALHFAEIIPDVYSGKLTKLKTILNKRIEEFILKYFLNSEYKIYGREEDEMGSGTHVIPTNEAGVNDGLKGYLAKKYRVVSFPEIVGMVETSISTISGGRKTRIVNKKIVKRKSKRY